MPKKTFDCKACGQNHERPINSKCTRNNASDLVDNSINIDSEQNDINLQILQELKSLSGRMMVVEQKVDTTAPKPSKPPQKQLQETSYSEEDEDDADDVVTPSFEGLKRSAHIWAKVEERPTELHTLQTKRKFRS